MYAWCNEHQAMGQTIWTDPVKAQIRNSALPYIPCPITATEAKM